MTNRFFWYELMTSDHAAAERFYAKVVGWKLAPFPASGQPYTVLEIEGGRGIGGLMPIPQEAAAHGLKPCWVGYIHVVDIDAAVGGVKANGGGVHRGPDPIPGVGRFAVCSDPQGAMFNMLQPETQGDLPDLPMGTMGGVDWHELHSSDGEAGLAFYKAQFGWSGTGAMDMGPLGTYQFFAMEPVVGDGPCEATAGGMMNDPQAPSPYWTFYVHVGDIDAAIARVTDNGGTIIMGPEQVPGGVWVVNATDPQGALFSLVGTRAEAG
jgi:predicted enzyme related to lactoylglutathione lyase